MTDSANWPYFTATTAEAVHPGLHMIRVPSPPAIVLSADEVASLRLGLGRVDMDTRWIAHLDAVGTLRLWRSWTGDQVFEAVVSADGHVSDVRIEAGPSGPAGSEFLSFDETLRAVLDEISRLQVQHPPRYEIRADARSAQAWSDVRLPFEPTDWVADFRDDLRTALSKVEPQPQQILHAVYSAADDAEFSDVENVLLYNVGTRWTRPLMDLGVCFERCFAAPPAAPSGRRFAHHHRYTVSPPEAGFTHWILRDAIATFDDVRIDRVDKPASVWAATRRHGELMTFVDEWTGRYAVRLDVTPQALSTGSIANMVKPLLDGIICALHAHTDPGDLGVVSERLAATGVGSAAEVRDLLTDRAHAPLGSRRLVKPFGTAGVQWNPADDLCVAAEIRVRPAASTPGRGWTISGSIDRV